MTFVNQPSLRCTWPCHLSRRVRSTFARSSSCILSKRSCELTSSLLGGDTAHPANQSLVIACKCDEARTQVSLAWGMALDTRTVNCTFGGDAKWAGDEDGQELVQYAPCDTASCDDSSRLLSLSSPQGYRRIAPPQATHCDLYHWSVIYWSGLSSTPFTPLAEIMLQGARDTTAFLVDPAVTTTTENGVCADDRVTHATGIFARLLKHIQPWPRHQHFGFAYADPKSLSREASVMKMSTFCMCEITLKFNPNIIMIIIKCLWKCRLLNVGHFV